MNRILLLNTVVSSKGFRLWFRSLTAVCGAVLLFEVALANNISQMFDVTGAGKLELIADGSRIDVQGAKIKQVRVNISRGDDSAEEIEKDYEIKYSQQGNDVKVTLERRHKLRSWHSKSLYISVEVPEQFDVDLETSGGRVQIQSLSGVINAKTSGGSLIFESVDGPITGKTSGGKIELDATSGSADLSTSGGPIQIGQVDGNVQARTSGGGISIERAGGTVLAKTSGGNIKIGEMHGSVEAKTSGGKITVGIPEQLSADSRLITSGGSITVYMDPSSRLDLDAHTSGGKVKSDLPITVQGKLSSNKVVGVLNGGGPELYLRASGGSIKLREI